MAGTWEPFGATRRMAEAESGGVPPAGAQAEPRSAPPGGERPARAPSRPVRREPARRLAIITCMDARIDPLGVLGLRLGDANVLRNAGATVSDDVLRSLRAAHSALGVRRAVLMGHTDCAGHPSDEAATAAVADGARRIRAAMGEGFEVETLMYDVASGAVTPV